MPYPGHQSDDPEDERVYLRELVLGQVRPGEVERVEELGELNEEPERSDAA